MLVILSFAGSAFATSTDLATATPTTTTGSEVRGGADTTAAPLAPSPLIHFSTGVLGMVNFAADTVTKTSAGYLISSRHISGSKYFGTANNITNIYWKQAPKSATAAEAITSMGTEVGSSADATVTFAAGAGWTSY